MSTPSKSTDYLLFFRNTGWYQDLAPEEIQAGMARFTAWFQRLNGAGQFKGGGPLAHKGKIISRKNVVMDGPFAESKEAIAGFFIIHADSLEHAVEIAKDCPGLEFGQTVEVRAVDPEPHELVVARERIAARNKA